MPITDLRKWAAKPVILAGIFLSLIIAAACFYNLENYPTIWWDEAIFSETAANLAEWGRYAFTEESPDKLSDLDFRISVGPALVLPVALAYKVLGISLTSGRLVAGAYLMFAFGALFLAARRLWGSGAALGAVALGLLGTDVLYWGRSVLGDIPALGLFFAGLWFLLRALNLENGRHLALFWGGLFLGLAIAAKEFYGLACLPPAAVLLLYHWRQPRRLATLLLAFSAGVATPILAYIGLKVLILGSLGAALQHFLDQKMLLCHEFFTPFTIGRLYPESFGFLLGQPLFWLGLAGLAWHWRKTGFTPGLALWSLNFLLWTIFYLFAVYWHRFALPALFLAAPPAAHLLGQGLARLTACLAPGYLRRAVAGCLMVAFIFFGPLPGVGIMQAICTCKASPPTKLVNYLKCRVPPDSLIETPEYELVFLDDDHRFHLMPSFFFVESTPDKIVLLNPRRQDYDFNTVPADYLILGSFGKSIFKEVYSPERVAKNWRKIAQVDFYDIYVPLQPKPKTLKKALTKLTPPRLPYTGKNQSSYGHSAPLPDHLLYH
jgi:hypothetical protein